jgi:chorismate dehydratase
MNAMTRLRVSAISYLNTAPLMWDFDHGDLRRKYKVDYTVPSVCAEMLAKGMVDIGIVPAAAYATIPGLRIIGDVCIASKGAVRSIYLVSKRPAEEVRQVAVDSSSRTSVALLRLLYVLRWRSDPKFAPREPKLDDMLADHDAALLIGDPALKVGHTELGGQYLLYDLGHEWQELTGDPFVYAFWAIRSGLKDDGATRDFEASRDRGVRPENIARTVAEWAPRLDLPAGELSTYLMQSIHYRLDEKCIAGLRRFYSLAAKAGALPQAPELMFL